MLILSHNVDNGGANVRPRLLEWTDREQPDLVTLQELIRGSIDAWRSEFVQRRYHVVDTFEFDDRYAIPASDPLRNHGLLIASRWPLRALDARRLKVEWPDRILSVTMHTPEGDIEAHTTHVPNGSVGYAKLREGDGGARLEKKMETLEGVYRALAANPHKPRILTGDFNEPMTEHSNGTFTYWSDYRQTPARYRDRWRTAAAGMFERLPQLGVRDIYRELHGPTGTGSSWTARNKTGRRYDHVFASHHFQATSCDYDPTFQLHQNAHAAIIATLELIQVPD